MSENTNPPKPATPVDELVDRLLECGGVLSQLISGMVQFEASGRAAPDSAPIPVVAHELIAGVLTDVRHHHSRRDLKVAARIVAEVTDAICENIFIVDFDKLAELETTDDDIERSSPAAEEGLF